MRGSDKDESRNTAIFRTSGSKSHHFYECGPSYCNSSPNRKWHEVRKADGEGMRIESWWVPVWSEDSRLSPAPPLVVRSSAALFGLKGKAVGRMGKRKTLAETALDVCPTICPLPPQYRATRVCVHVHTHTQSHTLIQPHSHTNSHIHTHRHTHTHSLTQAFRFLHTK